MLTQIFVFIYDYFLRTVLSNEMLIPKDLEFSEKVGLKHNIQKTKIMTSSPIASWQIDVETMETVTYFLGLQNHCRWCLRL